MAEGEDGSERARGSFIVERRAHINLDDMDRLTRRGACRGKIWKKKIETNKEKQEQGRIVLHEATPRRIESKEKANNNWSKILISR
jgi:hypothetical protein